MLYIRIKDGKPYEHPMILENIILAFPNFDANNLIDFAKFERVSSPFLGTYEIADHHYDWDDDVVKDIWTIRNMTEEEKDIKFAKGSRPYPSWEFDESVHRWISPVPYPEDNLRYYWNEELLSWDLI